MPDIQPTPQAIADVEALSEEIHLTRIRLWISGLVDDGKLPAGKSAKVTIHVSRGTVARREDIKIEKTL